MPVGINQPSNQIKLTNVSLVRMKKGKKRFEIPCYKNKVLEWRSGAEKDLDSVLQIQNVFLNVHKGQAANNENLQKAFGKDKKLEDIILEILNKGEIQVGEKERQAQLDRVHKEVVDTVAGKLVDPRSKRLYTTGMIEKALDQISAESAKAGGHHKDNHAKGTPAGSGTSTPATGEKGEGKPKPEETAKPLWTGVVTTRSAKSQALDAMKALIAHQIIPVARARMKLRITCPTSILKQAIKSAPKAGGFTEDGDDAAEKATGTVKDRILSLVEEVESQDVVGEEWEIVGFVEPGAYRLITDLIGTQTKGRARAEVLETAVIKDTN